MEVDDLLKSLHQLRTVPLRAATSCVTPLILPLCMSPTERCCLTLQKKTPTTTPCPRSAQEGLHGERDSASEVKHAPGSGHFQGHSLRETKGTNMSFVLTCLFSSGWRMPSNQNWFEDNRLLSLCMGLNHPQKLFLMPDRCSKTIWENTSFGWNFGTVCLWAQVMFVLI